MAQGSCDYTVAWICALSLELAAAKAMLDEVHPPLPQPETDHNVYTLGRVGSHNVVVACLPGGVYGTISATAVASHMMSTFRRIRCGLMVGIGGGVPSQRADIRLGDVVISKPTATSSGVIQYDYGKTLRDGRFQHTGSLNKPPPVLLKAVSQIESDYMIGKRLVGEILTEILHNRAGKELREQFSRPKDDWLFRPTYNHEESESTCSACDPTQLVNRPQRRTDDPYLHYGLIASGDQVMKDAKTRDSIAQDLDILCFEMEAAGLMDELPSLAIRGICDYCDSHKHKQWQGFAALAAASYAKALLSVVPIYGNQKESLESRKPVWMVPFRKNPGFVGREAEITRAEGLIMQQDGPGRVAICGLGGVGKTQIALELAYRMRNRDPECSIFWVSCTSYESATLSQESAGKWLLLFDNADDAEMWSKNNTNAPALTDFLPQCEQGRILFTTRSLEIAVNLVSSHVIKISEPGTETAVKILHNSLVEKTLLSDRDIAITLLKQLDFLPLAIIQAAAYINEKCIGLSDYLMLLQEQEPDVIDLLSEDFGDETRYRDTLNPPISTKERIDAVGLLKAFSFVSEEGGNRCLNLHRLVHLATRNWMRKNQHFSLQILKAADRLSEAFPGHDHTNRKLWREYLPHALSLISEADFLKEQGKYIDLIAKIGACLSRDGRWKESEELGIQVMELCKQILGAEHPKTLTNMNELVIIYQNQGQWKRAEELGIQVMELRKQILGAEHLSTLTSINNLASIYQDQRQWKKTEELGRQVTKLRKQIQGAKHPNTLTSMNNLKKAEELGVQVIKLRKQILGLEHPDTLTSINNLALTYRNQGQWKKAEELGKQVSKLCKQILGLEHPDTLTSMNNLASTYRKQGQWKKAEELGRQVTKLRKQIQGLEHPDTLTSMNNLASIYHNQGQ
ncbi:hypothetical protein ASPCADRAFT_516466 [Aspergillus carbonarius ITEM 5010]|uniref:Nucleoside phosphorylase domain-containing protein n=1 Tax=Aspergillus carbonarius (strain ITEM 5010) TaxID=602072 RepID=A0A1R3RI65_ASPC5|nr:hypothetical protein ASPCADRAFT_516466 [Aspergillus carbonarius ITEM 5010]